MAETTVDYIRGEKFATYFSNDSAEMKYMRTLYGIEGVKLMFDESDKEEGGIELRIPKSWYRRPKPPTKRNFTDEQREAMGERMRKAREEKNG